MFRPFGRLDWLAARRRTGAVSNTIGYTPLVVMATQIESNAPYLVISTSGLQYESIGEIRMLWTIFVILLVLWLVGLVTFHAIGWYIHILLVIALVVLLFQLFGGRRAV